MKIPPQPLTQHGFPTSLPRACQSFRCFVDDEHGMRLMTGEWQSDGAWWKFIADFAPKLARAGALGFIATTLPDGYNHRGGAKEWYGDAEYPVLHWHWWDGEWFVAGGSLTAFSERTGWPVMLLKWPRDLEGCPERMIRP